MPKADFTYEVRTLAEDPVGIEDYVVRDREGEPVGTVAEVLERPGGERLLVLESGATPLPTARRAVHWDAVDRIDHDAVAVWLMLDEAALDRTALELDPQLAVEGGGDEADEQRVEEPHAGRIPEASSLNRGPVDRPAWTRALAAFALMSFASLVAVIVVSLTGETTWALLLLVPAALAGVLAVVGYRAYRQPYEPRGARKP